MFESTRANNLDLQFTCSISIALLLVPFPARAAQYEFRSVALSDHSVPAEAGGGTFESFGTCAINDTGLVAFQGSTSTATGAIFVETVGGGLRLVSRTGNATPGIPGETFVRFDEVWIDGTGNVSLQAGYDGNIASTRGIWSESDDQQLGMLVRQQVQYPGIGRFANGFRFTTVNDARQVAFQGFAHSDGFGRPVLTRVANGVVSLIAGHGDLAPNMEANAVFEDFRGVALNAQGQTAFSATLRQSSSLSTSLWREDDQDRLELVLREGDSAPLDRESVQFGSIGGSPSMNSAGEITFRSDLIGPSVSGGNATSIWLRDADGALMMLARQGDPAPGLADGVVFDGVFSTPQINDEGRVAFIAFLNGTGIDNSNRASLWTVEAGLAPQLVVRSGDAVEVEPGTLRTLEPIASLGRGQSNLSSSLFAFNNLNQIAFAARFTDGASGILVGTAAIPEPPAAYLAVLGVTISIMVFSRRRCQLLPQRHASPTAKLTATVGVPVKHDA